MSWGRSRSNEPDFPGVLGKDGSIELAGGHTCRELEARSTAGASRDAWTVDRHRRCMMSPTESAEALAGDRVAPHDIDPEIVDRFALGDYAGALRAAGLRLGVDPGDEIARQYAESSRARLESRYANRIGPLEGVFNLAVPTSQVKWLGLDPQAASLLSLIDGQTSVAEVLELCPKGRLEALRLFTELLDAKAIVRVA
jgi:hypothetical protein